MPSNTHEEDLELLNGQAYKEYIWFSIFKNWKIFSMKAIVAFGCSFGFDAFDLFKGYSFFISFFIIEILYYNLINKDISKYKTFYID